MTAAITPNASNNPPDIEKEQQDGMVSGQGSSSDTDDGAKQSGEQDAPWDWETDPNNPYNWTSGRKAVQVTIIASIAFLA
jgi:hypothetical protein